MEQPKTTVPAASSEPQSHRHAPSLASHPSLERVHSDEEQDEEEQEILKANRIESEIQKDKIRKGVSEKNHNL
jgi:hypothetical protein